jgi:hypothetical protein
VTLWKFVEETNLTNAFATANAFEFATANANAFV